MREKIPFLRLTALLTACLLAFPYPIHAVEVTSSNPLPNTAALQDLSELKLPSDLGNLEEIFRAPVKGPFYILIQDAHAIQDAQRNIQKLIQYLDKQYGIRQVGVEGGKGRLDATLLRSFPDAFVRNKVLGQYFERGELSGADMAAVLSANPAAYHGLEDWKLYEAHYQAWMAAVQNQEPLKAKFAALRKEWDARRRKIYSPELNEFHERLEGFYQDKIRLPEFVRFLNKISSPALRTPVIAGSPTLKGCCAEGAEAISGTLEKFPQLSKLMASLEGEEKLRSQSEILDVSLRRAAKAFEKKYAPRLTRKQRMKYQQQYQAFATGQLDAASFLKYLLRAGRKVGARMRLTPAMESLLGHAQTLSMIRGTELFEELEAWVREIESGLIKTEAEKNLVGNYRRLRLFETLARLELTRDEWESIEAMSLRGGRRPTKQSAFFEGDSLLKPSLNFYNIALQRDRALYENALKMKESSILIAGGFHARGLTRLLKQSNHSYAVIMPKINSLAGQENYSNVMSGGVSYKKYLKHSYFDAFMTHATLELMKQMNEPDFRKNFKFWRDELIRTLSKEGRVEQAGRYTKYLEELAKAYYDKFGLPQNRTREEILKALERVVENFRPSLPVSLALADPLSEAAVPASYDRMTSFMERTSVSTASSRSSTPPIRPERSSTFSATTETSERNDSMRAMTSVAAKGLSSFFTSSPPAIDSRGSTLAHTGEAVNFARSEARQNFVGLRVQGLRQTLPEAFLQMQHFSSQEFQNRVSYSSRIPLTTPTQMNSQIKAELAEIALDGQTAGVLLRVTLPSGQTILAIENNTLPRTAGRHFVILDTADLLYSLFRQDQQRLESTAAAKASTEILYMPWIVDDFQRDELNQVLNQDFLTDFIIDGLRQHPGVPIDFSLEGVFVLAPYHPANVAEALQDERSGAILRAPQTSHLNLPTLAHELGHALLDGYFLYSDPIYQAIEDHSRRIDYFFYRSLAEQYREIIRAASSSWDFAKEKQHNTALFAQEYLMHALGAFIDRTGVIRIQMATSMLRSADIDMLIRAKLLPEWASTATLGFNKTFIDGQYYQLLEAEALKHGKNIIAAPQQVWEYINEIANRLSALQPQIDQLFLEKGVYEHYAQGKKSPDDTRPFVTGMHYQALPRIPDNLSRIVILYGLSHFTYELDYARRSQHIDADLNQRALSIGTLLTRVYEVELIDRLSYPRLDSQDQDLRSFVEMNGSSISNAWLEIERSFPQEMATVEQWIRQAIIPGHLGDPMNEIAGFLTRSEARETETLSDGESILAVIDPLTGYRINSQTPEFNQSFAKIYRLALAGFDLKFNFSQRQAFLRDARGELVRLRLHLPRQQFEKEDQGRIRLLNEMNAFLEIFIDQKFEEPNVQEHLAEWMEKTNLKLTKKWIDALIFEPSASIRRQKLVHLMDEAYQKSRDISGASDLLRRHPAFERFRKIQKRIEEMVVAMEAIGDHNLLQSREALSQQEEIAAIQAEVAELAVQIGRIEAEAQQGFSKNVEIDLDQADSRRMELGKRYRAIQERREAIELAANYGQDFNDDQMRRYGELKALLGDDVFFNYLMASILPLDIDVKGDFYQSQFDAFVDRDGIVTKKKAVLLAQFISSSTRGLKDLHPSLFEGIRIVTNRNNIPTMRESLNQDGIDFHPATLVFPSKERMYQFTQALGVQSTDFAGLHLGATFFNEGSFFSQFPVTIAYGLNGQIAEGDLYTIDTVIHETRHGRDKNLKSRFYTRGSQQIPWAMGGELLAFYSMISLLGAKTGFPLMSKALKGYYKTYGYDKNFTQDEFDGLMSRQVQVLERLHTKLPHFLVERILFNTRDMNQFLKLGQVSDQVLNYLARGIAVPQSLRGLRGQVDPVKLGIAGLNRVYLSENQGEFQAVVGELSKIRGRIDELINRTTRSEAREMGNVNSIRDRFRRQGKAMIASFRNKSLEEIFNQIPEAVDRFMRDEQGQALLDKTDQRVLTFQLRASMLGLGGEAAGPSIAVAAIDAAQVEAFDRKVRGVFEQGSAKDQKFAIAFNVASRAELEEIAQALEDIKQHFERTIVFPEHHAGVSRRDLPFPGLRVSPYKTESEVLGVMQQESGLSDPGLIWNGKLEGLSKVLKNMNIIAGDISRIENALLRREAYRTMAAIFYLRKQYPDVEKFRAEVRQLFGAHGFHAAAGSLSFDPVQFAESFKARQAAQSAA